MAGLLEGVLLPILLLLLTILLILPKVYYRKRPYDWKVQTVLITGGSQGIGEYIVKKCKQLGCQKIIILDTLLPTWNLPNGVEFYQCDVSDRQAVYAIQERLASKSIIPTILVNNAGIWNGGKRILELSDERLERLIQVNLMGPFWILRAFLPSLLRRKHGRIVNISSVLGLGGIAKMTDYCASKFAVYGMNEALRMELWADGYDDILTTVVCPFYVDTEMFRNRIKWTHRWLMDYLTPEYVAERIVDAIAKGKAEVWLPWQIYLFPILRLLPTALLDLTHKLAGSHKSTI